MPRPQIDEKAQTKGELRKLNALRKSIGDELGEQAFAKWLDQRAASDDAADFNVGLIENPLAPLPDKLRIPRGGAYAVRRGHGRFIVESLDLKT